MKFLSRSILLATLVAALLLPATAQKRTYQVLTTDIPFDFKISERHFHAGQYQFIFVGVGLVAVRDSHNRIVAEFVTRSAESGSVSPDTRLVFGTKEKPAQLEHLFLKDQSQSLEIVGEQLGIAPSLPGTTSLTPFGFSMGDRYNGIRFKE